MFITLLRTLTELSTQCCIPDLGQKGIIMMELPDLERQEVEKLHGVMLF
jgi:hypothetical protein